MKKNFKLYKGKILDLSDVDTSAITDMSGMFNGCKSLTSLDVSSFNTSNVTDMNWMFGYCRKLNHLDLSSFDTSNVTNMSWMFENCKSLKALDISSFNFTNVKNVIDLSSFDFKKVEDVRYMFDSCKSLTDLNFGKNLKVSLDLGACPLTYESALSVLNGLAKVEEEQELTLSKATYNTLALEDIKLAETKNWKINAVSI